MGIKVLTLASRLVALTPSLVENKCFLHSRLFDSFVLTLRFIEYFTTYWWLVSLTIHHVCFENIPCANSCAHVNRLKMRDRHYWSDWDIRIFVFQLIWSINSMQYLYIINYIANIILNFKTMPLFWARTLDSLSLDSKVAMVRPEVSHRIQRAPQPHSCLATIDWCYGRGCNDTVEVSRLD